jgi:polyisoprenoid-binding protein YceI
VTSELILGPAHGVLSLHTGREGMAGRAGHDLTIHVEDWSGVVTFKVGEEIERVRLVAQLSSFTVIRGDGGLKPLSGVEKATIRKQALRALDVRRHPEVFFVGEAVTVEGGGVSLEGTATVVGIQRPLSVAVEVTRADTTQILATTGITQTDFGIKPFSGMFGALRVRDLVDVRLDLTVPNL